MFIGHFGIGFGAKKAAPKASLGLLFLAAQFLDLLWPTLLLLKVEKVAINTDPDRLIHLDFIHYPISHSLLMVAIWSLLFGLIYWLIKRDFRVAMILAFCVLSHWLLDLIVHFPDLPLYPGNSPLFGFGVWQSLIATLIIEGLIFIIGGGFYLNTTKADNRIGSFGFWLLIILLVTTHILNIVSPPPPSVMAVAWGAQLQWLFVILAFWVDKNRTARVRSYNV